MEELKFKAYCVSHKIKQIEIAELLGLNLSSVNEKLNGKQPFTLSQVKILCDHYGISADEYFF
jgi:transcriptional regulator with XRE-family HTH domain